MRGAEAVVKNSRMLGKAIVIKARIPKSYRIKELDEKLRRERTRQEAKLLHRAKLAGVPCPTVLFVDEFFIGMTKIKGKRPKMKTKEAKISGEMLAKLHNSEIIHGDFTPANLIASKGNLHVIDFGLGFFSSDIEDKAIDVLTMLKSVKPTQGENFLKGYEKISREYGKIIDRIGEIRKRARYA